MSQHSRTVEHVWRWQAHDSSCTFQAPIWFWKPKSTDKLDSVGKLNDISSVAFSPSTVSFSGVSLKISEASAFCLAKSSTFWTSIYVDKISLSFATPYCYELYRSVTFLNKLLVIYLSYPYSSLCLDLLHRSLYKAVNVNDLEFVCIMFSFPWTGLLWEIFVMAFSGNNLWMRVISR